MDLSDVQRMVDDWEHNAEENARRYQEMSSQVGQVSITGSAADGAVKVTVGANGIPTDVVMMPKVRQLEPDRIAAAVLEAMRDAQSRYPQKLAEIMAQTVGDDTTTRHLLAEAQANFPPPQDEPPRTRPAPPPDDPDDFSSGSYLERDR